MTAMEEPGYLPFNVKAKADYVGRSANEISLISGKIYSVTATDQKGLWWKSVDQVKGHSAWFPAAYTTVLPKDTGLPNANLPPPITAQPRPGSTTLVQPAITQKTPLPQPTQTQPLPQPNTYQQPLPQPQQPLPTPQPRPNSTSTQQPLPTPNNNNNPQPQLPARNLPQPNPKPVPQIPPHSNQNLPQPNRNSGVRPTSTSENRGGGSQPKLDVDQFHVVPVTPQVNQDKPPSPLREQTHTEPGTYNTLKLHLVECKDLKGLDKSGTPTAFIVQKDPYAVGTQGSVIFQTNTLKGPHPQFNDFFKIELEDPEKTQIIVRISNGKKHATSGKAYVGEAKIELRASVSKDFRSPNSVYKWFPIMNGTNKVGEAKIWVELTDLREKTYKPPSNFQRLGHIGVVDGVFSADNLPKEMKEQLRQAGVRKKDLNNPELRDILLGLIMNEGGEAGGDQQPLPQQPQPQQALPSLPQQPLPNPRPSSLPQPVTHSNSQPAILFNPAPSLPPQQNLPQQQQQSQDEPMMRGTPPPIKGTATNSTPQPNTNGRGPRGPARAPKADITGGGGHAHTAEKTESQPVQEKPKPSPMGGGMGGDLMAEIAKGRQLRSAQETREPELPAPVQGGLAGALAAALDANRKVLGGGVDDESEGSDWD